MRIVIASWGSTGDVLPPIAIGWTLRQRGHEVSFIGNPYFERQVREAGLEMIPVGHADDHRRMMGDVDLFDLSRKSTEAIFDEYYFPRMRQYHEATDRAMRQGGQVLLGGELGSMSAAERHRLPWVLTACSPSSSHHVVSRHDPPHPEWILPGWARPLARHGLGMALYYRMRFLREGRVRWPKPEDSPLVRHPSPAKFRAELGLPPLSRLNPDCTLCMWPDWFAAAQPDWPEVCVVAGFPLYPRPLPRAEGRPRPIVITAGSMAGGQRDFFDRAARACQLVGHPGVIVSPQASNVPTTLPAGVSHLSFAPFSELLSQASLVLHHGGIGTTAYALAAGVPQLMAPLRGDQFDNANRVQRLGVGEMLSGHGSSVEDLAALMRHYIESPDVARRCSDVQRRIDPDAGLRRAAEVVEQVVREGSVRVAA